MYQNTHLTIDEMREVVSDVSRMVNGNERFEDRLEVEGMGRWKRKRTAVKVTIRPKVDTESHLSFMSDPVFKKLQENGWRVSSITQSGNYGWEMRITKNMES